MRIAQISAPALVALATAGCAQQHADYYALDSVTHQPVAVVQRYTPAAYAKPRYAKAVQRPATTAPSGRGLFNEFAENRNEPANPQPHHARHAYAPRPAARPADARNRVQPSYAQAQERSYGHPEQAPYPPPNHGAAATYTAVAQSNPFQQARWY